MAEITERTLIRAHAVAAALLVTAAFDLLEQPGKVITRDVSCALAAYLFQDDVFEHQLVGPRRAWAFMDGAVLFEVKLREVGDSLTLAPFLDFLVPPLNGVNPPRNIALYLGGQVARILVVEVWRTA